jgi:hypothetical protein
MVKGLGRSYGRGATGITEVIMSIFEILNKVLQCQLTIEDAEGLLANMINRAYKDGFDDGYDACYKE